MEHLEMYNQWISKQLEDPDLSSELASIKGNTEEISDRFYRELEFGTGGLRGVIGAGTNRMNVYTVRKATQGLANYINTAFKEPSIAISYDSRIKSDLFAKEAAKVMAGNNIKVHLYDKLMPTPCASFAVRELKCSAGIMITASHNPAKYNGYKVYGADGCQITTVAADEVLSQINSVDIWEDVKTMEFDTALSQGLINYVDKSVEDKFLENVYSQCINKDIVKGGNLSVVYTPLNGTGNLPVRAILDIMGVKDVTIVKEQELPDGNFPTCPFPNPEIPEALHLGLELCKSVKPDLLLATDPDCDRVGIATPDKDGNYVLISGNEVGALLLEYICTERIKNGSMPKKPIAVKTIVTTEIAASIAKEYGVKMIDVLTGFKFIGEQIFMLEEQGEADRFIFGFEESYGYLAGSYVRDKDAVVASMLICEMAAVYKSRGISILDALAAIYAKYGVYHHCQASFTCEGASGMERMNEIMTSLRNEVPTSIGGHKVICFRDYKESFSLNTITKEKTDIDLPKSDVLTFDLEGNAQVVLRPSGTEPKIKAYYTTLGQTKEIAVSAQEKIAADFKSILGF